jgi:hypothetical protein
MQEEFQIIEGWNEKYSIGTLGSVFSHITNKILKHKIAKSGFRYVSLSTGRKITPMKSISVAKLMALAYIPNPNDYAHIEMVNGDPSDLRVENIKWIQHSHNDKKFQGYSYKAWHKDTPHTGFVVFSMRELSDKTGLSCGTITNLLYRNPGKPGKLGWAITCQRIPDIARKKSSNDY